MSLEQAVKDLVVEVLQEHGLIENEDKPKKGKKADKEDKPAKGKGKKVTIDTVKDKLTELANEKGRKDAVKMLKTFGASKASELEESDYAKFVAAVDKAIGGGDDEDEDDDSSDDMFGDDD